MRFSTGRSGIENFWIWPPYHVICQKRLNKPRDMVAKSKTDSPILFFAHFYPYTEIFSEKKNSIPDLILFYSVLSGLISGHSEQYVGK